MQVFSYLKSEILGTNLFDLNLEEFNNSSHSIDSTLLYGYRILEKGGLSKSKRPGIYKYLNVTMPTEYCQEEFIADQSNTFDEIYGICPFSCLWLNNLEGTSRHKFIYYPVSVPTTISPFSCKCFDVIYHGGIHSDKYLKMLSTISKFNYRYASMSKGINPLTQYAVSEYATDLDLSAYQKYLLLSQCKISIAFNNFPLSTNYIANIKKKPLWQHNGAFSDLKNFTAPQFKSRVNEAAALGVLNLVEKDHWNVIENFYEPGVDFIYFESSQENLAETIYSILKNYDDYATMRYSAYQKSRRYTRDQLYIDIRASRSWSQRFQTTI